LTTQFWNTNSSTCVTRYSNVQGPCYFDYQCQYNVNLTCDLRDNLCKCQIANQYWSTTLQQCLTYRNYTQSCNSTYLCNINQVNLTCSSSPTCNCPTSGLAANSCDCAIDQYFDTVALGIVFLIFTSINFHLIQELIFKFEKKSLFASSNLWRHVCCWERLHVSKEFNSRCSNWFGLFWWYLCLHNSCIY
jgi:heme/copper-type cytochrome/quinol oxidase subunit 3